MQAGRQTQALQWRAIVTRTARNEDVMRANCVVIRQPQSDLDAALAEAARQTNAEWEAKASPEIAAVWPHTAADIAERATLDANPACADVRASVPWRARP